MPLFFDRSAIGTSINIDTDIPKVSNTTFTAARKFSAPFDPNQDATDSFEVKTNDEHLTEHAAHMKGVAMAAESIASDTLKNIQLAREQLAAVDASSNPDVRQGLPNSSEFDVLVSTDVKARSLASVLQQSIPMIDTLSLANDLHHKLGNVFKERLETPTPTPFNPVVPQLDSVSVEMSKNRGTVDCFFSKIKFSLPLSQVWNGKIKAIRIFRSTLLNPVFARKVAPVITMRGMEQLSTLKLSARSKGLQPLVSLETRYRESGVLTALSILNPIDSQTNLRISTNTVDSGISVRDRAVANAATSDVTSQLVSSFLDPNRFGSLDPSVAQDLNVIRNIINQDPSARVMSIPDAQGSVMVGPSTRQSMVTLNRPQAASMTLAESNNNDQEFREICVISLDKLKSKVVGDTVQYEYFDETVGFGKGYQYYVLSVDRDMVESIRSQIVNVTIEGIRIPPHPKRVFSYNVAGGISLNIIVGDQLVEKFEIFRRESIRALAKEQRRFSLSVSDLRGFNANTSIVERGSNGFIKIGECLNSSIGQGSSFYDREVVPGLKYIYRVYSVDIFGNKSESPHEIEVFVPDRGSKNNELLKPTLTAEVDATTGKAKLTFKCSDPRVRNLFLSRRDLTLNQKAFTAPGQVNFIKLGNPKVGEGPIRFEDTILRGENKDVSWTGMFENSAAEITYIDQTVKVDHIYQYRIHGVDLYGNSTSYEMCKPFLIYKRPLISSPVNVVAEVVQGPNFTVGGVKISWQEGNVDVPSEDVIGNQETLSATSVRTLYQLERRKVGEERWEEFPLVPDKVFFDPSPSVQGNDKPGFRPPLVESNQTYVYRVKALQTGSFVSNYSSPVEVFAGFPTTPPTDFRLRASDPKVRPFYIVLNWNTSNSSGVIDKWEIERAVVNNFAAARLNVRNPNDFQQLKFVSFREVYKESSRFRSQGLDLAMAAGQTLVSLNNQTNGLSLSKTIFTGEHQFQDTDIHFGNTYFYRIRSVGIDGVPSSWVYRGIKVTEDEAERTIANVMNQAVINRLTDSGAPFIGLGGSDLKTSFSLQPTFSMPKGTLEVEVGAPPPLQLTIKKPVPLSTYSLQTTKVDNTSTVRAQLLSDGNSSPLLFRSF